jgi:hypothetical protein
MRRDELGRFLAVAVALALLASCSAPASAPAPSPAAAAIAAQPSALPTPAAPATANPNVTCTACWPLSGRPVRAGSVDKRPLLIKIDNAPQARPHYGITQADMVFEILVEGFVTRLAAVFQSQDPQTIGNIRSARLADRSLTPMVRGALVYSGTSTYEVPLIQGDAKEGRYIDLSADYTSGYYRVNFRPGPYNMFTSAAAMRQALAAHGANDPQSVPAWSFFADPDHDPMAGGMRSSSAATDIVIPYREDTSRVEYKYDPQTRTYGRWQNSAGKPVHDIDGVNNQPVAAANVVIIQTEIWEVSQIVDAAGSHAHDMRLTGTGSATIFRDGRREEATWSRAADTDPFTFKNASGETVVLDSGQTWVHVIPTDWSVTSS